MKKQAFLGIAIALLVLAGFLLWNHAAFFLKTPQKGTGKLSVVATFYPLAYFAEEIGGDRILVKSIVPTGVEPHDYEPTPKNILTVNSADIFLINGAGLDPWAEKIRSGAESRGVTVLEMSDKVALLSSETSKSKEVPTVFDPHFWLDPILAETEVLAIRDALISRDGDGSEVYAQNAKRLIEKLRALDQSYRGGLTYCGLRTVVTSHNAFAYLSKRYGFETLSVSGLAPEAEPSPRRLVELAETAKAKDIHFIFFETLVSPKVAETLAREIGAETLVFNPIEGLTQEDIALKRDYFSIMNDNLKNLQKALVCQE